MSFSFGFSGDDIEEDPDDVGNTGNIGEDVAMGEGGPTPIAARKHDLVELLSSLPSQISYSTVAFTSPKGFTARLPRRELFDVKVQLMAEDDATSSDTNPLAGLEATDLQTNIYEGGYKTWECSLDLVRFLLDRGPRKDLDDLVRVNHVIEMGCGTALPTCLLWQYAIKNGLPMEFTVTDYNADVLRLVTLPNLVLAWVATLGPTEAPFSEQERNPLAEGEEEEEGGKGDLEITPNLIQAFKTAIANVGISLTIISGSWTPTSTLLSLIPSAPDLNTFILGSETIYSPSSLSAFTEAIVALMKRVKSGKAIIAAKRVYFGVGGSVDGFREECARRGCVAYEMEFEGLETAGVRRCLIEVQMY